ncbi:MAG: tRNA pseudouridine(55) synthase TruB [Chloroflexi bacterium]|nr:MAG: tRNA pseudouridine(55) synthase TruB [Chloroflexota bacterium]
MSQASGILNVNKPAGPSSFDIVRLVRRGTAVKKAGHAGTLDPMASGVLLVLLGQAVRISEYLMDLPKTYRARVRLGFATETYDAEGRPVGEERSVVVPREQVQRALDTFVGEIEQTPPAYSAVKVEGQRAYRLARKGAEVVLRPRRARIYKMRLLEFESPDVRIEVECGKGTYIRSLAHDLGQALGCGGHLAALERTRVGPFSVDSAVALPELEGTFGGDDWRELVLPLDCGLTELPVITLHIEDEKDIRHGQAVRIDEERLTGAAIEDGRLHRAYAEDGALVAIVVYEASTGLWRSRKVFLGENLTADSPNR